MQSNRWTYLRWTQTHTNTHTIHMCAVLCVLPIPFVIECECMNPLALVHPYPIPLDVYSIHFSLHLAHFRIIDWISCMWSVDIVTLGFTVLYWTTEHVCRGNGDDGSIWRRKRIFLSTMDGRMVGAFAHIHRTYFSNSHCLSVLRRCF